MGKIFLFRLRGAVTAGLICAVLCGAALADDMLVPVGEAVGIQIDIEGVLVAGLSEVDTDGGLASPAEDAGIREGDVIVAVNGCAVNTSEELVGQIAALSDAAELTVVRNGDRQSISVCPVVGTDGGQRLGLWLRDGVTGIGTITYYDPETGAFGALGHGVNNADTGLLLPINGGSVCRAQIVDVKKGVAGTPGELAGCFDAAETLGVIGGNTVCGIFGRLSCTLAGLHEPVPVAEPDEIVSGPATILTCISGDCVREFQVDISRTGMAAGDGRDLMIHVTDPELLATTGGIVQGMSGSPILQNGRIVGAVTHVLVNDPTRGYGVFIKTMLAQADSVITGAAAA